MTTALPPASDFTATATTTKVDFRTATNNLRAFLVGLLGQDGTPATALAALGALGGGYLAKTAPYTLTTSDRGRVIEATGTWTLSLPAAAAAGAGFAFCLINRGTGTVTVDPSGAETIDGAATVAFGPGRTGMIVCTGAAWLVVGDDRQTGITDTAAGKLMQNHAHGLGAFNTESLINAVLNAAVANGFYSYAAGDVSNPGTGGGSLLVSRHGDNWVRQLVLRAATHDMWSRYSSDNGSTWSVSRIFNQATILGSVSQSAGVPTGAVMQYGSSADGKYLRLANGLQICWHNLATTAAISMALLGGYRNAGQTWAFPATFAAAPIVVGNPSTLTASGMVFSSAGTAAASAFFTAPASQASAALAGAVVAIGMWFNP